MGRERDTERQSRVRQIRRRVFAVVSLLIALMVALSLPGVQRALFPGWLIEIWGRVIAVVAVLAIGTILLLPVMIEANLNPRPLSGPGRVPRGKGIHPPVDDQ